MTTSATRLAQRLLTAVTLHTVHVRTVAKIQLVMKRLGGQGFKAASEPSSASSKAVAAAIVRSTGHRIQVGYHLQADPTRTSNCW